MKVGFTCSCFDLLHTGHILMLREAKTVCDYLIVGIQTDPTIDRPNKNKPIQSIFERVEQIKACKYVDEIVIYETEDDLSNILRSFPIDVRIIGEEYRDKNYTGKDLDMDVHYNLRRHDFSSSKLRQRVEDTKKE